MDSVTSMMESIPPILGLAMLFVAFFVLRALLRRAGQALSNERRCLLLYDVKYNKKIFKNY